MTERFTKKRVIFTCSFAKKVTLCCEVTLDNDDIPHIWNEALCPQDFKGTLTVDQITPVWPPAPPEVRLPQIGVQPKRPFLSDLLERNMFLDKSD